MLTPQTVLGYVKSEPFRPFRLHVASGRIFDVRHPEMIKVLKSNVLVFKTPADGSEIAGRVRQRVAHADGIDLIPRNVPDLLT